MLLIEITKQVNSTLLAPMKTSLGYLPKLIALPVQPLGL
jgi:hypothetical protein